MRTRGESDILQERDYVGEPTVNGRIILECLME